MTTALYDSRDMRLLSKKERDLPEPQRAVLVRMRRAIPAAQSMDLFFSEFVATHDTATTRAAFTELVLNLRCWLFASERNSNFEAWLLGLLNDRDFKYEDFFVPDGKLAEFMLEALDEDKARNAERLDPQLN